MRIKVWVIIAIVGTALAVTAGMVIGRAISPTPKVAHDQLDIGSPGEQERPADLGTLRVVMGKHSMPRHDIGGMTRGSRREVRFVVSNPSLAAVTIGAIRVSCDCFRVELDATRVEAGTEVGGRAVIDLAHELGFAGGLTLDAEGADNGRPVFALKLSVKVK